MTRQREVMYRFEGKSYTLAAISRFIHEYHTKHGLLPLRRMKIRVRHPRMDSRTITGIELLYFANSADAHASQPLTTNRIRS